MNSVLPLILAMLAVTDAALQIAVNPGALQFGNSRNLNIRCSYSKEQRPAPSRLHYLLISFASDVEKPVFRYLASISIVDGLDKDTEAAAAGHINITRGEESWLSLTWSYPFFNRVGLYKCEANSLNLRGDASTVSKIVEVGGVKQLEGSLFDVTQNHSMDVEQLKNDRGFLFDVVKNQSRDLEQLNTNKGLLFDAVEQLKTDRRLLIDAIHKQSRDFEQLKTDQGSLKASFLKINSRFDSATHAHFSVSPAHNGRRYYLSRASNFLVFNEVDTVCALYGGYLAEVDDNAEFQFIKSFLAAYPQYTGVLCSGTDEVTESHWVNVRSKTQVNYIRWGPHDPNGGRKENCLFFWQKGGWYMADWICPRGKVGHDIGYLCEIPE
ncbi:unnamed protein product [Lymnaea stagnalis]|uniref:C-type lectin domain-containing protein n=1 Tax=Lymnaea stagnalis TaxID=6523 RepID=A0AAV2H5T2_LYMST